MIEMTVEEVLELGLWDKVCTEKGWSVWSINKGLVKTDELVKFDKSIIENKTDIRFNAINNWLMKLSFEELLDLNSKISDEMKNRNVNL